MPQKNAAATRCEGAPLTARPQLDRAHAQAQGWPTRPRSSHADHRACSPVPACCLRCTDQELRLRPFGRHGARPRPQARAYPCPSTSRCLREEEEQAASITSELASIGNLGTVRSTACMNSTRPSLMSGRLLYLSVLRFSAPPRDPSTHNETPCSSADALCWLPARRLLRHHRQEGCLNDSRAPHGAAAAERGVVVRGRAMYCGCGRYAVPRSGRK